MSHLHQPSPPDKKAISLKHLPYLVSWCATLGLHASSAVAQSVYRCGDQYGTHANCTDSSTPRVQDPRSLDQKKVQDRLTQHTQAEAAGLEKQRMNAEQHAPRVFPSGSAWTSPNTNLTDNNSLDSLHTKAHRKKTTPYFTAKNGSVESKKAPQAAVKQKAKTDTSTAP